MQKNAVTPKKYYIKPIKRQYFYEKDYQKGIDEHTLDGQIEIGEQHHNGEHQRAFCRGEEEKRLLPLYIFFLVIEHPSREPVQEGTAQEEGDKHTGKDKDYLVLADDERVADFVAHVEETDDGKEQARL